MIIIAMLFMILGLGLFRPYYVCKDVKREEGTTYKNCRCETRR